MFSVIAVSETWGNVNNEMFLNIPGYNRTLVNRKTGTGGVALFILNNLHFDVCADLNAFANDNFECVFVKLSSSTFKTKVLGSVYRPPNSNLDLFMSGFHSVVDHFNHFDVECLIARDFNIDLLKYDAHRGTGLFLDCLHEHALVPLITPPTRFTSDSFTLIDNIFSNKPNNVCCQVS